MGASGAPAEQAARRPETEELRDRALEKASLAGDGGWAAWVLLHHRLEEGGVGEVAEDQMIEARPQVGELARLPGAPRAGQDGEPLRIERSQEAREGAPQVAVVVEAGALDETREVRMLLQIVEHAVQDGLHHRRLEAAALAPGPALAALRDQRDDRRDAPGEDRLVQRPLVAEVMVEARLVLEPRLGGYLPHRYAGEAALGEAPPRGVERGVAGGRGFAGAGGGRPGAHAPPRTRTNVRLSRECPLDRVPRAAGECGSLPEAVPRALGGGVPTVRCDVAGARGLRGRRVRCARCGNGNCSGRGDTRPACERSVRTVWRRGRSRIGSTRDRAFNLTSPRGTVAYCYWLGQPPRTMRRQEGRPHEPDRRRRCRRARDRADEPVDRLRGARLPRARPAPRARRARPPLHAARRPARHAPRDAAHPRAGLRRRGGH